MRVTICLLLFFAFVDPAYSALQRYTVNGSVAGIDNPGFQLGFDLPFKADDAVVGSFIIDLDTPKSALGNLGPSTALYDGAVTDFILRIGDYEIASDYVDVAVSNYSCGILGDCLADNIGFRIPREAIEAVNGVEMSSFYLGSAIGVSSTRLAPAFEQIVGTNGLFHVSLRYGSLNPRARVVTSPLRIIAVPEPCSLLAWCTAGFFVCASNAVRRRYQSTRCR